MSGKKLPLVVTGSFRDVEVVIVNSVVESAVDVVVVVAGDDS